MTESDNGWIKHGKKDEGLYGLKKYRRGSPRFACFSNFQYVLDGKLARGSQPNYLDKDKIHTVSELDVRFLRQNKISCLISANNCEMDTRGKQLLANAHIGFFHFKIEDFHAPNPKQLKTVARLIEEFRHRGTTIVYCGYGEGRTGTFVAAWALLMYMPSRGISSAGGGRCSDDFLQDSFGVEKLVQKNAVRMAVGLPPLAAPAAAAPPLAAPAAAAPPVAAPAAAAPPVAGPAAAAPPVAGPAATGPDPVLSGIGLSDASPSGVLFPDPVLGPSSSCFTSASSITPPLGLTAAGAPPPGLAAAGAPPPGLAAAGALPPGLAAAGALPPGSAAAASDAGSFVGTGPTAIPAPPPAFAKFSSDSSLSLPPPPPLPPLPAPLPNVPSCGRGSSDMGFPDDDNFGMA